MSWVFCICNKNKTLFKYEFLLRVFIKIWLIVSIWIFPNFEFKVWFLFAELNSFLKIHKSLTWKAREKVFAGFFPNILSSFSVNINHASNKQTKSFPVNWNWSDLARQFFRMFAKIFLWNSIFGFNGTSIKARHSLISFRFVKLKWKN